MNRSFNDTSVLGDAIAPVLESLESRKLLAVTLDGDVLRVYGGDKSDEITVEFDGAGAILVNLNGKQTTWDEDVIADVVIRGKNGNDAIEIIGAPVTEVGNLAQGSSGRDTILGGSGDESLDGNSGNDEIYGGPGDDSIRGGTGHDLLGGEDDNDTVRGDDGEDDVYGGDGDDDLLGGEDRKSVG